MIFGSVFISTKVRLLRIKLILIATFTNINRTTAIEAIGLNTVFQCPIEVF